MSITRTFRHGAIQAGAAVILLGGVAGAAAAWAQPGGSDRPTIASSSGDQPGDISGPCDEAEHATDPRCAGTITTPTTVDTIPADSSTTVTSPTSTTGATTPSSTASTSTTYDVHGGDRHHSGNDDGPLHDRYDDHGGDRPDHDDDRDDDSSGRGRGSDDDDSDY